MEWVSYLAGEPHSDQPVCVSPMLCAFCIRLNDALPGDQRQRMRPYLARTIGTAGDGLDERRNWMCADWLIRVYTPAWLDLVPNLQSDAEALRALPIIASGENVVRAMEDLNRSRQRAAAARAAAQDATWAATRDAAQDAARDGAWAAAWAAAQAVAQDAARDAAWAATWDAAQDATWDAAQDATWAATWDAAQDAARDAAWDAAWDAAQDAARNAAGDTARDAARDALRLVTAQLRDSILSSGGLLDRMLPTEMLTVPVAADWRDVIHASV
jgi:hypothetical protein